MRAGLIGLIGNMCGKRNIFILDSGASSNFMSKNIVDKHKFKIEDKDKQFNVRLANGRVIATSGCVCAPQCFLARTTMFVSSTCWTALYH